jgi:hypothetical protein
MGASVIVYWPGLTGDQMDSMPGFHNDDKAWGNWMAERDENTEVLQAIRRLGAEAILTVKTDGWDDDDVTWVTPDQLSTAAARLREAVRIASPDAAVILKSYEVNANRIDPVAEEFMRDLDDVIAMARWAHEQGATKITLEVNW